MVYKCPVPWQLKWRTDCYEEGNVFVYVFVLQISSGNEVERGGSCLSDGGMVSNAGEGVALSASCDQEDSGDEVYGIATMVRLDQVGVVILEQGYVDSHQGLRVLLSIEYVILPVPTVFLVANARISRCGYHMVCVLLFRGHVAGRSEVTLYLVVLVISCNWSSY